MFFFLLLVGGKPAFHTCILALVLCAAVRSGRLVRSVYIITIVCAVGYADYEGSRYHLNVHTLVPQHKAQRPRRKQSAWSAQ